ncbi:ABC transporter substrate-binding protein [Bradyrhizobium sp. NBAIM20]|uniref:ABC transporter substrate-binding protein n=1 Tax=unclassified Bradyrhizobium TaxID=2631580 RepID=UPI001CD4C866|nr:MULTISPECIES: ABC transporter substrate-binding protein [unclassified Bradyrhizobium]MCA1410957.1 ABC transporter substrate-binding protein [Bradyrhizobium sp. NBAIM20]MCA1461782.1 ABC transporter substrate-binding protein [Bradyrhizobium sp. NBAIM18]
MAFFVSRRPAFGRIVIALAAILSLATMPVRAADRLVIGVAKLASAGPVFIAIERGYFQEQGFEPSLKYFEAAQPIAVAAASGDIDIGATALTAGFYNMAAKGVLKIVAAQSHEEPGYQSNAIIASLKGYDNGFNSLGALAGKSIGIAAVGSTAHYSLGLFAEKYQIDLKSVRIVPLQTIPNMISAVRGGQVDGTIIPSTAAIPLIKSGEAKLIGYVGDETPWQIGAVFTSTKTATERRDVVTRFIAAYRKGTKDFFEAFDGPSGKTMKGEKSDIVLAILSKYTGQPTESLKDIIPYVDPDARLDIKDVIKQIRWYQSQGFIPPDVDPQVVFDTSQIVEAPAR